MGRFLDLSSDQTGDIRKLASAELQKAQRTGTVASKDLRAESTGNEFQDRQLAQLELEMDQAFSAGVINIDQYNRGLADVHGLDRKSWVQSYIYDFFPWMLGADMDKQPTVRSTGGVLQTMGDVFMAPAVIMSALTRETEDAAKREGRPVMGVLDPAFSLSGFANAWRNKTSYYHYVDEHEWAGDRGSWGNFAAGLAMDIAMDPTTYLTFGVGPGIKVATSGSIKAGASATAGGSKALAKHAGPQLTLTRFGDELFNLAAPKVRKLYRERMKQEGRRGLGMDEDAATEFIQETAGYMVNHFDELIAEYAEASVKGKWKKFATAVSPTTPGARLNIGAPMEAAAQAVSNKLGVPLPDAFKAGTKPGVNSPGLGVDDLFQETASVAGREMGIDTALGQRVIGGAEGISVFGKDRFLPKVMTKPFAKLFDVFDSGWDAPADLVQRQRLAKFNIENEMHEAHQAFSSAFAGTSTELRRKVAQVVEARWLYRETGEALPGSMGTWDEETDRLARFVGDEMEKILQSEREANYGTMRVRDYLSHIYDLDPLAKVIVEKAAARNGIESINSANGFAQQRMIASLAEGIDIFGDGALIDDAYDILMRRKQASVEMMEKHALWKYTVDNHGVVDLLIREARRGMSNGIVAGFFRRMAHGHSEVLMLDQVWKTEGGGLKKLGFKEGDLVYNERLYEYLSMTNTANRGGKLSARGLKLEEELGVNDNAKWHQFVKDGRPVSISPTSKKGKKRQSGEQQFTIPKARLSGLPRSFKYRGSPQKLTTMEAGKKVRKPPKRSQKWGVGDALKMLNDPKHPLWMTLFRTTATSDKKLDFKRVLPWLEGLHKHTVKHLDSQLTGFIPDIDARVLAAWREASGESGEEAFQLLIAHTNKMGAPIEKTKMVPQVPPTLVELARATRRLSGIRADDVPMTRAQERELLRMGSQLGFDNDTMKQLVRATFGTDKIESAYQADVLEEMFRLLTTDNPLSRRVGLSQKVGPLSPRWRGDPLVRRRIRITPKVQENIVPEVFDQNLGIPVGQTGGALNTSPAGVHTSTLDELRLAGKREPTGGVAAEGMVFDSNKGFRELDGLTPVAKDTAKASRQSSDEVSFGKKGEHTASATKKRKAVHREYVATNDKRTAITNRRQQMERSKPYVGDLQRLDAQIKNDNSFITLERKFRQLKYDNTGAKTTAGQILSRRLRSEGVLSSPTGNEARAFAKHAEKLSKRIKASKVERKRLGYKKRMAEYEKHTKEIAKLRKVEKQLKVKADKLLKEFNERHRRRHDKGGGLKGSDKSVVNPMTASDELRFYRSRYNTLASSSDEGIQAYIDAKRAVQSAKNHMDELRRTGGAPQPLVDADIAKTYKELLEAEARAHRSRRAYIDAKRAVQSAKNHMDELRRTGKPDADISDKFKELLEAEARAHRSRLAEIDAKRAVQSAKNHMDELRRTGNHYETQPLVDTPELRRAQAKYNLIRRAAAKPDADISDKFKELLEAEARYEDAFDKFNRFRVGREPALNPPDRFAGGLKPTTSPIELDVWVPESVAKVLEDFGSPLIGPDTKPYVREFLRRYDAITSYFKSQLVLPWSGSALRDGFSNVVIAYLAHGVKMFSPRNNFENARRYMMALDYVMLRWTDYGKMLQYGKDFSDSQMDDAVKQLGELELTSKVGTKTTLKEIAEHAHMWGVYRGMTSGDVMDKMSIGSKLGGGVSGTFAGGAIGAVADAYTGGDAEHLSYFSIMGAVAGAFLGGRSVRGRATLKRSMTEEAKHMGGIPVVMANKVTGTLQSNWNPILSMKEAVIEMPFRLAIYMSEWVDTGSSFKAANAVYKHLNDWNSLSTFERRVARRVVPFYSWSKHAIRQTGGSFIDQPGRQGAIFKAFQDWDNWHEDMSDAKPDYLDEKFTMMLDAGNPLVPEGKIGVITGLGLPQEELAAALQILPNPQTLTDALRFEVDGQERSVSGLLGLTEQGPTESGLKDIQQGLLTRGPFGFSSIGELLSNTDYFTGRQITSDVEVSYFQRGETWDTAPSWIKGIIGYKPGNNGGDPLRGDQGTLATVNPHIAWVLGEIPPSRFIYLMRQVSELDADGKKRVNSYTLARQFLGLNVTRVDPETSKYFLNRGRIMGLVAYLNAAGRLRRRESWYDVDPDDETLRDRKGRGGSGRGADNVGGMSNRRFE